MTLLKGNLLTSLAVGKLIEIKNSRNKMGASVSIRESIFSVGVKNLRWF
jgi:hypothetical protein